MIRLNEVTQETDYRITPNRDYWTVTLNDYIQSTCVDVDACLHSVWIQEGSVASEFYVEHKGIVSVVFRDKL